MSLDPAPTAAAASGSADEVAERLAPFVAWMAAHALAETVRREHREAAEEFLRWTGTTVDNRAGEWERHQRHLHRSDPAGLARSRAGMARYAEYQAVRAQTLP